jgi:hypothetical protein
VAAQAIAGGVAARRKVRRGLLLPAPRAHLRRRTRPI